MRAFIFATASAALALENADHADVEEHLSLLQLSARPRSVAEDSDDLDAHDVDNLDSGDDLDSGIGRITYPITWDIHWTSFGPDGTWTTPHCKHIQGCQEAERKCPAGCNGVAAWTWYPFPNSNLGVPNDQFSRGMHYTGCWQDMAVRGAFGSWMNRHKTMMNCKNGPDSNKPAPASSDPAFLKELGAKSGQIMQTLGMDDTQMFYNHEFCPADCVNDCAMFQLGQFLSCGSTQNVPYKGYNWQRTKAVGPNPQCPIGSVVIPTQHGRAGTSSYTWCGEQTTTTTTPPPPAEEPVDNLDGDEAVAAGDPHMTSNTGRHFDLE